MQERVTAGATAPSTDEEEALRARSRYRRSGIPALDPDPSVGPLLHPDERVFGLRDRAVVRRIEIEQDLRSVVSEEGPLYVTDRRLLQLGERGMSIDLLEIDELTMSDDRILVTLGGSRGVTLDVDSPHQLRVLIAAAKAALRTNAAA
jgi:hypothetical protein